jgi:hypothetical protein
VTAVAPVAAAADDADADAASEPDGATVSPPVADGPIAGDVEPDTRDVGAGADADAGVEAGHKPAGEEGTAATPEAGTYRKPSASPSPKTRLEMPTPASCQAPPPFDTKTAQ